MHAFVRTAIAMLVACAGLSAPAKAQTIGPGDISAGELDTAPNIIAIDLSTPHVLPAGTYTASTFNYELSGGSGTVTPFLAVGGAGAFTPVAIGSAISSGVMPFQSTAFGGSNTFTLPSETTVFAGVYWNTDGALMPIGFAASASETAFVRFSGANAPVLGDPISGGDAGTFSRLYDFSISLQNDGGVPPIPEPGALALFLPALAVVGFLKRRPSA